MESNREPASRPDPKRDIDEDDLHPRYRGLSPERLAARLAEDLCQMPVERRLEIARLLTLRGWADL